MKERYPACGIVAVPHCATDSHGYCCHCGYVICLWCVKMMGARGVWLGVLLTYPDLLLSTLRIFYLLFYDCITGYLPYFHQHWLHQPGEKPLHQQPTTTTTSEQQFIGSRLVLLFCKWTSTSFSATTVRYPWACLVILLITEWDCVCVVMCCGACLCCVVCVVRVCLWFVKCCDSCFQGMCSGTYVGGVLVLCLVDCDVVLC